MNTLKQLNYLLDKKAKRRLAILLLMIIAGSAAELMGVTIVSPIITLAMDTGDIAENKFGNIITRWTSADTKEEILLWMIGITILIYLLKNIYMCYMYKKQYQFAADVRMNLAVRLMTSYMKQPYSYFLQVNSSDLMRGVSSDTDQLYQLISNVLQVASNAITALAILTFLAISNFWMTFTIAIILGACLCIIVFGLQKINRRNGRKCQYLAGQVIKNLRQAFEGVKEIKIMNTERYFIDEYTASYKKNVDLSVKNSLIATLPKYLIEVFAVSAILIYLGINIAFNPNYYNLLPQLAVFCVAAFKLLPSVNALYGSFNSIIYYKASIDLVYHDIKETDAFENTFDQVETDNAVLSFEDCIQMENVTFRYPNSDRNVLQNVNLCIPKGKSVAFIGKSGGGKTTSADIILALLTPTEGKITIDGVDIQDNLWGWKKKLGYIPQTIYLTDDTIRANVAFGMNPEQIKDNEIWRALEDAQLKEYVESLPEKLDTKVGERGVRISGGQRQRIGIARALYHKPEVLVFDEATSALDNETEKEVMKAIEGLQGTKTIILIAHRLSTIEKCDMVYRIEDGKVVKEK